MGAKASIAYMVPPPNVHKNLLADHLPTLSSVHNCFDTEKNNIYRNNYLWSYNASPFTANYTYFLETRAVPRINSWNVVDVCMSPPPQSMQKKHNKNNYFTLPKYMHTCVHNTESKTFSQSFHNMTCPWWWKFYSSGQKEWHSYVCMNSCFIQCTPQSIWNACKSNFYC